MSGAPPTNAPSAAMAASAALASSHSSSASPADGSVPDESGLLPDGPSDTVDLCKRKLTQVSPQLIEQLQPHVLRLALGYNHITSLPSRFADLTRLRYLNIRANALVVFPPVITELPALEILDIGRNRIKVMPGRPGSLLNLRVLSISSNRLKRLPAYLARMTHLRILRIERNPLVWPPSEITSLPPSTSSPDPPLPSDARSMSERQRAQLLKKHTDDKRKKEEQAMVPWIRRLQQWIDQQQAVDLDGPLPARSAHHTVSPRPLVTSGLKSEPARKAPFVTAPAMTSQTSISSTVSSLPDGTMASPAYKIDLTEMERSSSQSAENGGSGERERFYTPPPGSETPESVFAGPVQPPLRSSNATTSEFQSQERAVLPQPADNASGEGPPTLTQLANSPIDDPLPPVPRLGFSRWARSRAHRRNESSVSSTSTGSLPKSSSGWAFPRRHRHGDEASNRAESPASARVASPVLGGQPWGASLSSLSSTASPQAPPTPGFEPVQGHGLRKSPSDEQLREASQPATFVAHGASNSLTTRIVPHHMVPSEEYVDASPATDTVEQMVTPTMGEAVLAPDHAAQPSAASSSSLHGSSHSAPGSIKSLADAPDASSYSASLRSVRSPPPDVHPPPRQPPQGLRKLSLASSATTSSSTSHSPSDSVSRLLSMGFTPSLPTLPSSATSTHSHTGSTAGSEAPAPRKVLPVTQTRAGPSPSTAAHAQGKSIDTERNSYFKRFSAMPMPVATKTIPTPVLRFVDGTRGLLFSLSQIQSALKQYVSLTLDERISLQFHKILEVANTSMTGLIRALERFDSVARTASTTDTEHMQVVRLVLVSCRDSLSTFKRVASVLQLQLKPLQQTADVRLTRSFLMMLYGSCVELSNCWSAIQPDLEAVQAYLHSETTLAPLRTDKLDNTLATISEQSIVSSSSPISHAPWKADERTSESSPPTPTQVRRPTPMGPYHAPGPSNSSAEWLDAVSSRESLADVPAPSRARKRSGFVRTRTGQLVYEDGTRVGSISSLPSAEQHDLKEDRSSPTRADSQRRVTASASGSDPVESTDELDSHLLNLVDKVTMTSATAWANLLGPALDEDIQHFTHKESQVRFSLAPPDGDCPSRGASPGRPPRSSTPAGGLRDARVGTLLASLRSKAMECDRLTGLLRSTWQECSTRPRLRTPGERDTPVDRLWEEANRLVRHIVGISTVIKTLSPDYSFAPDTLRTLGALTSTCHELMIHMHFLSPDKMHSTAALVAQS